MRTVSTVAALSLLTGALLGCADSTEESVDPSISHQPVVESMDREANEVYRETVEGFPYELPDGYAFPDEVPAVTWFDTSPMDIWHAEAAAFHWWGCAKYDAAWNAIDDGDTVIADQHYDDILAAVNHSHPGLGQWTGERTEWGESFTRVRGSGDSGFCVQWINRLNN